MCIFAKKLAKLFFWQIRITKKQGHIKNTTMLKSRFRYWVVLPVVLMVMLSTWCVMWCRVVIYFIFSSIDMSDFGVSMLIFLTAIFLIFVWIWIVFGELRTRAVVVVIEKKTITSTNFLGLGTKKEFDFSEFDGFITVMLSSESGDYEHLYIFKSNKRIISLSEYYHSNYTELKRAIREKVRFNGDKPTSIMSEIKNIFQ